MSLIPGPLSRAHGGEALQRRPWFDHLPRRRTGMTFAIGIDPGVSGGLAKISAAGTVAIPMPATERDIWDWFGALEATVSTFAVIEKVQGYIGPGSEFPGSAMFRFGKSAGFLLGCLVASGIPFEETPPQRWQKALGISARKKTESKGQWKNRLKAKAQQLYPDQKVTLSTADALLIATYCKRWREGTL